jgi:multiple sugar transport system permease protein
MLNSILLIYLFPGVLLIIPLFAMLAQIGDSVGFDVQDNLPVLIFTYLAQTLPVAIYMRGVHNSSTEYSQDVRNLPER